MTFRYGDIFTAKRKINIFIKYRTIVGNSICFEQNGNYKTFVSADVSNDKF